MRSSLPNIKDGEITPCYHQWHKHFVAPRRYDLRLRKDVHRVQKARGPSKEKQHSAVGSNTRLVDLIYIL